MTWTDIITLNEKKHCVVNFFLLKIILNQNTYTKNSPLISNTSTAIAGFLSMLFLPCQWKITIWPLLKFFTLLLAYLTTTKDPKWNKESLKWIEIERRQLQLLSLACISHVTNNFRWTKWPTMGPFDHCAQCARINTGFIWEMVKQR